MEQRVLGRTGRAVSVIGLGTWQLGADWGDVSEAAAMEVLRAAVDITDRSRVNLGTDQLDLVQLHCPPAPVFSSDAVYDALDTLVAEERIGAYGVSVETCAEALAAIARPGVASVQIILNAFRRKPLDRVLPAAAAAGVPGRLEYLKLNA